MLEITSEIGFWDYTCPGHGSVEEYSRQDWDILLNDMSAGGFNSLVLGIKWLTTGYRSRHEWLDQDCSVSAIASDNAIIYHVLNAARERGIRTWLLVVASIFNQEKFGFPSAIAPVRSARRASYDLDQPGVTDRILALFEEIAELFGDHADGMIVELEVCDGDAPHRIPLYDKWAQENGRAPYADLKNSSLEPRFYPQRDWRDYTTLRRIQTLHDIERTVRRAGFTGKLSHIVEIANLPGVVIRNVNLEAMAESLPTWPLVTYDSTYDRNINRAASMEFCLEEPRRMGFEVQFITRGVMTFGCSTDDPPLNLEEQWRMSLEDAIRCRPAALWFMGSDARSEGLVCNNTKLPAWGFENGRSARLRLMEMVRASGVMERGGPRQLTGQDSRR